jgi:hypothetical protein
MVYIQKAGNITRDISRAALFCQFNSEEGGGTFFRTSAVIVFVISTWCVPKRQETSRVFAES